MVGYFSSGELKREVLYTILAILIINQMIWIYGTVNRKLKGTFKLHGNRRQPNWTFILLGLSGTFYYYLQPELIEIALISWCFLLCEIILFLAIRTYNPEYLSISSDHIYINDSWVSKRNIKNLESIRFDGFWNFFELTFSDDHRLYIYCKRILNLNTTELIDQLISHSEHEISISENLKNLLESADNRR